MTLVQPTLNCMPGDARKIVSVFVHRIRECTFYMVVSRLRICATVHEICVCIQRVSEVLWGKTPLVQWYYHTVYTYRTNIYISRMQNGVFQSVTNSRALVGDRWARIIYRKMTTIPCKYRREHSIYNVLSLFFLLRIFFLLISFYYFCFF